MLSYLRTNEWRMVVITRYGVQSYKIKSNLMRTDQIKTVPTLQLSTDTQPQHKKKQSCESSPHKVSAAKQNQKQATTIPSSTQEHLSLRPLVKQSQPYVNLGMLAVACCIYLRSVTLGLTYIPPHFKLSRRM